MNTYKLTEVRNFKTLKENCSFSLTSCNSFTKNMLNMESNMILMVLIAHEKIKFLANLDGSRILGAIGIKRGIIFKLNTLFGKHLCWSYLGLVTDSGEGAKRPLPLPKICHTYPAVTKLGTVIPYLKKIQKAYESRDTRASPLILNRVTFREWFSIYFSVFTAENMTDVSYNFWLMPIQ